MMIGNLRLLDAEQILTLLFVYAEPKKFIAIVIKSNDVDTTVIVYLSLQLEVFDEVYDHFEVENEEEKLEDISCAVRVNHSSLSFVEKEE